MNHVLEKETFLDFDGRKKMLLIFDAKTNSDQKFVPTLKRFRKAVLAFPRDSFYKCVKTGEIDKIGRSLGYSASEPV